MQIASKAFCRIILINMVVKLRLARRGRKNLPFYWLVVSNSRSPRDSNFIDKVGTYNPMLEQDKVAITKPDIITKYLNSGAQCSDTVVRLLHKFGFVHELLSKMHNAFEERKKLIKTSPKQKN